MASEAGVCGSSAPAPRPEAPAVGGGNPITKFFRFVRESVHELKKVEWPGQNQVIQGTIVVLVACAIVGTYLWINDQIWQQVVKKLLGE